MRWGDGCVGGEGEVAKGDGRRRERGGTGRNRMWVVMAPVNISILTATEAIELAKDHRFAMKPRVTSHVKKNEGNIPCLQVYVSFEIK